MRGYGGIEFARSDCIRFIKSVDMDGSESDIFRELSHRGIVVVYIDSKDLCGQDVSIANLIAIKLKLQNAPYQKKPYLSLLDDLITFSSQELGLVIVIGNASILIDAYRDQFFDLVECFLHQFHHWHEGLKPCYLCFQVDENKELVNFFLH